MNAVLIGMPGAGKSTVGVLAAKALGKSFVDTDLLIQEKKKCLLREIIDKEGINMFLKEEEAVILSLKTDNSVIATGGSAIYSEKAMRHLKKNGKLIYLWLTYPEIEKRIYNPAHRGIVMEKGRNLKDTYNERIGLYEKYADCTINCSGLNIEEVVQKVVEAMYSCKGP